MQYLLISSGAIILLLALLLVSKRPVDGCTRLLAAWLFITAFDILLYILYLEGFHRSFPSLVFIIRLFPIIHCTILLLLVSSIETRLSLFRILITSLPALFFFTRNMLIIFGTSAEEKADRLLIERRSMEQGIFQEPSLLAGQLLEFVLVSAIITISLQKLNQHIKSSKKGNRAQSTWNLQWLKTLVATYLLLWVVTYIALFFIPANLMSIGAISNLSVILFTVILILIAFQGIRRTTIFSQFALRHQNGNHPFSTRQSKHGENGEPMGFKLNDLLSHMEKEKPYLEVELSIRDLADQVGLSVNQLSYLINQVRGVSFYDFVNQYRIEEFKRKLDQGFDEKYTYDSISRSCGFKSKSTFYQYFKKYTGTTPNKYQSQPGA